MERVDGIVIREELPAVFNPPVERRRIGEELIDALVELHSVDWHTEKLAHIGRASGYLERRLRRWSGQIELTPARTRPLAGIAEVMEWLRAHLPASSETTVVQGDYRFDNVAMSKTAPARLLATFDWEMATLGDRGWGQSRGGRCAVHQDGQGVRRTGRHNAVRAGTDRGAGPVDRVAG